MKIPVLIALLGALALSAGCAAPPEADEPPEDVLEPWRIVAESALDNSVHYSGFLNESFGIAVGYAGEIHYTTDGGASWPQAENQSWCRFGLEIVDEQVAWHCGNGGHVRVSTDGGRTWQQAANFGPNAPAHCRFLSFLDATTGWAATESLLAATTDGGRSWQEIALPEDVDLIMAIELRTATDGYLLDSSGRLLVTADSGSSWEARDLDFTADAYLARMGSPIAAVRFVDADHGMIVLSRGDAEQGYFVWSAYTRDGGATWQHDQVTTERGIPLVFLSRDASTLSVQTTGPLKMTVLRFTQP
jgi:photosystem II stability/assembly factor-like uncharacterized protein